MKFSNVDELLVSSDEHEIMAQTIFASVQRRIREGWVDADILDVRAKLLAKEMRDMALRLIEQTTVVLSLESKGLANEPNKKGQMLQKTWGLMAHDEQFLDALSIVKLSLDLWERNYREHLEGRYDEKTNP